MRAAFVACIFALIAIATCDDFFVTTIYSDDTCSTMIGRRATNFYQPVSPAMKLN